jgi:DNA-binding Lrp family transcriptional regulator
MTLEPRTLDEVDVALLGALQRNARQSHGELAALVGLSVTGVHKRIKRLETQGFLRQTVTLLDRERLGLDLLCFLSVTFKRNTEPHNMDALRVACAGLPEVLECYTLTGSFDALVKIAVRDHKALREFLARLSLATSVIDRIQTSIVLEEIKETHELALQ